jgi:bifunctional oligoribonuclease and PAP phosphatase NrnA
LRLSAKLTVTFAPQFMQPLTFLSPALSKNPQQVVITFHQKPDGDAMGSGLGLCHVLQQLGHQVQVISPTNWADFLNWMPGNDKVLDYERQTAAADKAIAAANYIFCLDFNTLSRTKKMQPALEAATAQLVLIDHHQEPQVEKFAFGVSDTSKSSTCEMVYDFVTAAGWQSYLSIPAAECLYTGLMTDTGSFRFASTTASVHQMAAHLKTLGINHSQIHENMFDNFLENRFRFIGHVLSHRMEIFYEYNTALIAIPQADLIKFGIVTGDTEGLVNYPLSIKGIKLAAIIIDRGEERKSSFRSKGGFDVNTFARKYFNGGGHYNAAGGQNKEPLEEVVRQFIAAMKENTDQLSTYQF